MDFTRRTMMASSAAAMVLPGKALAQSPKSLIVKAGGLLPAIGMGTWLTFDVPLAGRQMAERSKVLDAFFDAGGGMIDSSPMYGRAEAVIGKLVETKDRPDMFSATKIWTPLSTDGPRQLSASHNLWQEKPLDLVYVHNLLKWQAHLKTLRSAKEAGHVRYIGLTTSHGRRHQKLETLMRSENIDAVQFTYNILNRDAEKRLLPTAIDQGITVIINRPFMGGALFERIKEQPLPEWAREIECQSWAEIFLKYVISHPGVTCAIPATRDPDHMRENMRAGNGLMPDESMRARMVRDFTALL